MSHVTRRTGATNSCGAGVGGRAAVSVLAERLQRSVGKKEGRLLEQDAELQHMAENREHMASELQELDEAFREGNICSMPLNVPRRLCLRQVIGVCMT
ncbi:hypothetical protein Q0F98_29950 [Paenibacillus amylolyticus]|nr:hypothetical protein Q0F98_29950 [Paenibacillus amylolyticus]